MSCLTPNIIQKKTTGLSISELAALNTRKMDGLVSNVKGDRMLIVNRNEPELIIVSEVEKLEKFRRVKVKGVINPSDLKSKHGQISKDLAGKRHGLRVVHKDGKVMGFAFHPGLVNEVDGVSSQEYTPLKETKKSSKPEPKKASNPTSKEKYKVFRLSSLTGKSNGFGPTYIRNQIRAGGAIVLVGGRGKSFLLCTDKVRKNRAPDATLIGWGNVSYDSFIINHVRKLARLKNAPNSYYRTAIDGLSVCIFAISDPTGTPKKMKKKSPSKKSPSSGIEDSTSRTIKIPWDVLDIEIPENGGRIQYDEKGIEINV